MWTLTPLEVEEFCDEADIRPALWTRRDLLLVRRDHDENLLAIKFIEDKTNKMFSMYVKGLCFAQDRAERYALWLLRNLTSYGWREATEKTLRKAYPTAPQVLHAAVARALCTNGEIAQSVDAVSKTRILDPYLRRLIARGRTDETFRKDAEEVQVTPTDSRSEEDAGLDEG